MPYLLILTSAINSETNAQTANSSQSTKSNLDNRILLKRGLKIAALNIHQLSAPIDEVRILLSDKCLDILAIQETKLNASDNNNN